MGVDWGVLVGVGMLPPEVGGDRLGGNTPFRSMSEKQLEAFWAAVEADASLQ